MNYCTLPESANKNFERNSLSESELEQIVERLDGLDKIYGASEAVSKNVRKRHRRSDTVDKETLKIIRNFGLVQVTIGGRTVGKFQRPPQLPRISFNKRKNLPNPGNENKKKRARLPTWEHTGARLKWHMAMQCLGDGGWAFTLNFGPDRLRALLDDPRGFSRALEIDLNRTLKRELRRTPDFCFLVEATHRGKIHVHGGIEASHNELSEVNKAMLYVGGKGWVKTRSNETQSHICDLFFPDGWARYSMKDIAKIKRFIRGNAFYVPQTLRSRAKSLYGEIKKIVDS